MLTLLLACHPLATDVASDSGRQEGTGDPETGLEDTQLSFDLLYSLPDDQKVGRVRFPAGIMSEPEIIWEWLLSSEFPDRIHKPHGLAVVGDEVVVTSFDYYTDSFISTLDLETGAYLETNLASAGLDWAGEPRLNKTRAAHNAVPVGEGWVVSDSHNHRLLGLNAQFEFAWEISQDTLDDPYLSRYFSGPNDVETLDMDGVTHLLVSARGDEFNHLLLFAPAEPLRPWDAPWEITWRWPQQDDHSLLYQNHNPHPIDGGLMVADSMHNRLLKVSWEGEILWEFPGPDCPEGSLNWPRDAVYTPDGSLLISDSRGERIIAVRADAECIDEDSLLWSWDDLGGPYQLEILRFSSATSWRSPGR